MLFYKVEHDTDNGIVTFEISKSDMSRFCTDCELDQTHLHKTNPKHSDKSYARVSHKNYRIVGEWEDGITQSENDEKILEMLNKEPVRFEKSKKLDNRNVLVIPDLHAPWVLDNYLEFCIKIYNKYNCDTVVFTGDVIDQHFTSYHETDPDTVHGAGMELELAKAQIKRFYDKFPNAKVCLGNHDKLSNRKAFSSGVSKRWIKSIEEVLETPNWEFRDNFIIDNVKYTHGVGGSCITKRDKNIMSHVTGHYHSRSYIDFLQGENNRMFAMQLGAGCDQEQYAFAYSRDYPKFHVNCGVVLNNGRLPILEYMDDYIA